MKLDLVIQKKLILTVLGLPLIFTGMIPAGIVFCAQPIPATLEYFEVKSVMHSVGDMKSDRLGKEAVVRFCYDYTGRRYCSNQLYLSGNGDDWSSDFAADTQPFEQRRPPFQVTAWVYPYEPSLSMLIRHFNLSALVINLFAVLMAASFLYGKRSAWVRQNGEWVKLTAKKSVYDQWVETSNRKRK